MHTPVHTPENTPVNPFFVLEGAAGNHKDHQSTRWSGQHSAETCVTQHIVRGSSGTVHASRGRTFQKRLFKVIGCCIPGNGSITGVGSGEAAKERGRLSGPSATDFCAQQAGPLLHSGTVPSLQMEAVPERAVPLLRIGRRWLCHGKLRAVPWFQSIDHCFQPASIELVDVSHKHVQSNTSSGLTCCATPKSPLLHGSGQGRRGDGHTGRSGRQSQRPEAAEEQNVQAPEVTNLNSRDSSARPRADHNGVA